MSETGSRRKSLDPKRLQRSSEGNYRIHLQSTKAICRNRSLINTTDSLKLYENQIILKNPILSELDEALLQKRPLSLCFDLGSSGEEINISDTSPTISSVSSSSSSSNNSRSGYSSSCRDNDQLLDEDVCRVNKFSAFSENTEIISDRYFCFSTDSPTKESVTNVIPKVCNCKSAECNQCNDDNVFLCSYEEASNLKENFPNRKLFCEQSYNLSISDDLEFNRISVTDNDVVISNKFLECEIPRKEIVEIMRIFNLNSAEMIMSEDNTRSLICSLKLFINLSDPVRMGSPTHLHNASLISDKTLLPRGGFELVSIDRSTSCKEIIEHLFAKFHIQENYCGYSLFERTMKINEKDYLKRLGYDFSILSYLINMVRIEKQNFTAYFQCKRFVLQENEKTEINWSTFSISELSNFLRILDNEENERRKKIIDFYSDLGIMIKCQMQATPQ